MSLEEEERLCLYRLHYFLTEVARGTVAVFLKSPADLRLGVLAAIVVNQLVEFIHKGRPDLHENLDLDNFRRRLAKFHCPVFPLLRDVAEAIKHPILKRRNPPPKISGLEEVRLGNPKMAWRDGKPIGWRDGQQLALRGGFWLSRQMDCF